MGADPSQPDGRGQKPSDETKDPSPEGVSPWSDDEFAALFSTVDLSGNTLYRELRLDPDGVVGEHIESEMRDALERRIPDSLLRRAMCTVCGETEEGRVVTSLEFRRNGGSLVPAAHLVEDPDPSEPGGFRGQASDKKKKLVVGTIAGNGALDERDWEIVPGQVKVTVLRESKYAEFAK